MSFGLSDQIGSSLKVTTESVRLRWKEGTFISDRRAAPYIGYNILIRNESSTFTFVKKITFQVTPDQWQEVTVTGLEPDTKYWFDIAIYRIYSDGRIFQNNYYTAEDVFGEISAVTLQSNVM